MAIAILIEDDTVTITEVNTDHDSFTATSEAVGALIAWLQDREADGYGHEVADAICIVAEAIEAGEDLNGMFDIAMGV